jgi:WD40 repeat protein
MSHPISTRHIFFLALSLHILPGVWLPILSAQSKSPGNVNPHLGKEEIHPIIQVGHSATISEILFLPGRNELVSASNDQSVKFWDITNGWRVSEFQAHALGVLVAAISKDGNFLLTGGGDKTAKLWSLRGIPRQPQIFQHHDMVVAVAFSEDGKLIATGSQDGEVKVWIPGNTYPQIAFRSEDRTLGAMAFVPGTALLAVATHNGLITFVNAVSGFEEKRITTRVARIGGIAFGNDKTMALATEAGLVSIWNYEERKAIWMNNYTGKKGVFVRIAFEPDKDKLIIGFSSKVVEVLTSSGRELHSISAETATFSAMAFIGNPRVIAVAEDEQIGLYDIDTGKLLRYFLGDAEPVNQISISTSGELLLSGIGRRVEIWDLLRGERQYASEEYASNNPYDFISTVAFSPCEDSFSSGRTNGEAQIWWIAGEGRYGKDRALDVGASVNALAFDSECNLLAIGSGATRANKAKVTMWKFNTPEVPTSFSGHKQAIDGIAISKTGMIASADNGGNLIVRRVAGEEIVWSKQIRHLSAPSLCFSSDGLFLAGADTEKVFLWNTTTGNEIHSLPRSSLRMQASNFPVYHPIRAISFSRDGKFLAAGGWDGIVSVWRLASGDLEAEFHAQSVYVNSIAFTPNSERILAGEHGGCIEMWDIRTHSKVVSFYSFDHSSYGIFSKEGYYKANGNLTTVAFEFQGKTYPFEEFDLYLNRPDLVLSSLNGDSHDLIQAYQGAFETRLQLMGIRKDELGNEVHVPQLELAMPPQLSSSQNSFSFGIHASDSEAYLDRINVFVNDVPIVGIGGLNLRTKHLRTWNQQITIELGAGNNKIQVSAMNNRGAESLKETFNVTRESPATKPNLYFVAIGISTYSDKHYNLDYAAKDAADLEKVLITANQYYEHIYPVLLQDQDATKEQILATKQLLKNAEVDDHVILFFSGHGVLDNQRRYYFGTGDMDFKHPERRGIRYEDIEGLLDGLKARQKLLLFDTCHSGWINESGNSFAGANRKRTKEQSSALLPNDSHLAPGVKVESLGTVRAIDRNAVNVDKEDSFVLLQNLFVELRRGSGAQVIAAVGGDGYSEEGDEWKNGVFTYVLLEGLKGAADKNHDGSISVSELREYVSREVYERTGGRQRPVIRRQNLQNDFRVY